MPRWISRLLRTSIIGFGVVMIALAAIYLYAIHALFDASFEHHLGFTAADFKPLVYAGGGVGVLLVLTGILVRLPQPSSPPQPRSKRKKRSISARRQ